MPNTRLRAETRANGEVQLYERNRASDECSRSPFNTLVLDFSGIPVNFRVKEDRLLIETYQNGNRELLIEFNIKRI